MESERSLVCCGRYNIFLPDSGQPHRDTNIGILLSQVSADNSSRGLHSHEKHIRGMRSGRLWHPDSHISYIITAYLKGNCNTAMLRVPLNDWFYRRPPTSGSFARYKFQGLSSPADFRPIRPVEVSDYCGVSSTGRMSSASYNIMHPNH